MCIIAIKPTGVQLPDTERIVTMFDNNPDGAGIMYAENDQVFIKKGFMTVEPLLEYLSSRDWTQLPVVLHFRIGTAGPNNELNCHPYPVGMKNFTEGTCKQAMVHNGILYDYDPPKESEINDTQVFLHEIVEKLPENWKENSAISKLVSNEIGTNKLAFLDKDGTITKFGEYIESEGCYYSNDSFISYQAFNACSTNDFDDLFDYGSSDFKSSLSFEPAFSMDDEGLAFLQAWNKQEFQEYLKELEEKCERVDNNTYMDDLERYYEVDPSNLTIFKY